MIPTCTRVQLPRYPNGWFQVAYANEVKPGDVKPLKYFGKDLVLFRAEDGEISVLDAYCPHLGAHLGHGGKVQGNCVRCPFHAWEFDTKGQCTKVPYATKIPPRAKVRPWHVKEINGLIMVWHHAKGEAPSWEVPVVPEYGDEEWTPYDCRDWTIRTHNQEMAENAVDSAHFRYLHGTSNLPKSVAEAKDHILHMKSTTGMETPRGGIDGQVEVYEYGFGFTTTRFTGLVETLLVASVTPIDEEFVHMRFSFSIKKIGDVSATRGVGKAFRMEVERQVEQDIPIWENKIYTSKPMLVDGDGPIAVYRRWVKQFYCLEESAEAAELSRKAPGTVSVLYLPNRREGTA
jgi:3-ketosteroid 9alpha-monooxygenase subunit A